MQYRYYINCDLKTCNLNQLSEKLHCLKEKKKKLEIEERREDHCKEVTRIPDFLN